jgi:hypothetical protein
MQYHVHHGTAEKGRVGIMEWRIYKSTRARKSALTQLIKGKKYNYLVVYLDSRGPAILVANAAWVQPGTKYVDR